MTSTYGTGPLSLYTGVYSQPRAFGNGRHNVALFLMFPPKHYLTLCDLAAINRLRAVAKLGGDCDAELSWPQGCSNGPWRLHEHVRVQVGKAFPPAPRSLLCVDFV